jgi:hypothetical protein
MTVTGMRAETCQLRVEEMPLPAVKPETANHGIPMANACRPAVCQMGKICQINKTAARTASGNTAA